MAITSAVIAAASLGYGAYAGEEQASARRRGQRQQERAQDAAESAAVREGRVADEEANRARRKKPDLTSILEDASRQRTGATPSIDPDRLLLGRSGLLGL